MKPLIPARRRGIVYVQLISRLYNRPVEGCLPMFKVLVVEDDRDLRQLFARVLQRSGYETLEAGDGQQALEVLEREYVDVIISDIMMPVMDGYELVRSLREADMKMPVLMITAKDAFDDMRLGFLSGSDDYMVKPVDEEEMLLRIAALLRRSRIVADRRLNIGGTELNFNSMSVTVAGKTESLPKKEFLLLFKLLSYPGRIFTRRQLMDEIWDLDSESDERTVDVHINRLRDRFRGNADFEIQTVRGLGYKAVLRA